MEQVSSFFTGKGNESFRTSHIRNEDFRKNQTQTNQQHLEEQNKQDTKKKKKESTDDRMARREKIKRLEKELDTKSKIWFKPFVRWRIEKQREWIH